MKTLDVVASVKNYLKGRAALRRMDAIKAHVLRCVRTRLW
jgi:hypothetical protein